MKESVEAVRLVYDFLPLYLAAIDISADSVEIIATYLGFYLFAYLSSVKCCEITENSFLKY